jgi:hypothetical protein
MPRWNAKWSPSPPTTSINLWFYLDGSKKDSRFESYREAWWLLDPERKALSKGPDENRSGTAALDQPT